MKPFESNSSCIWEVIGLQVAGAESVITPSNSTAPLAAATKHETPPMKSMEHMGHDMSGMEGMGDMEGMDHEMNNSTQGDNHHAH